MEDSLQMLPGSEYNLKKEFKFIQKQTEREKFMPKYFFSEATVDRGSSIHTSAFRAGYVLSVMTAGKQINVSFIRKVTA